MIIRPILFSSYCFGWRSRAVMITEFQRDRHPIRHNTQHLNKDLIRTASADACASA